MNGNKAVTKAAGLFYSEHRGGGSKQGHPPLILIHGSGGSRLSWPSDLRRLRDEHVYGLDLPGHGQSRGIGERAIEAYAEHICLWMEAVGLEQAVLVGHSMGGAIALVMAMDARERVAGLVLISTGGRLRVHPAILALTSKPETYGEAVDQVVTYSFSPQAPARLVELVHARMAEIHPQVLYGDFLACDGFDVLDRLGEITTPVEVICGTDDLLTPLKYSCFMAEAIADARVVTLDGAGHMAMLERPVEVATVVKEFMDRVFD